MDFEVLPYDFNYHIGVVADVVTDPSSIHTRPKVPRIIVEAAYLPFVLMTICVPNDSCFHVTSVSPKGRLITNMVLGCIPYHMTYCP